MTKNDPELEHVLRSPLPWREIHRTECGLVPDGRNVITAERFRDKLKREGRKRSALTTCMTCWETAQRWPTWQVNPVQRLARESQDSWRGTDDPRLRDDLLAIEELISRHPEEFKGIVASLGATVRLADHRGQRRRRAVPTPRGSA